MDTTRITRSYFALAGLYTLAASLIWSVNTLFLLDAGLDIGEVFIANAAFSVGMVAFEIPTGVVADTLGRRASYLASIAVLGITTLLYLGLAEIEAGVIAFSVVSVLMGLGFTFYSGALEAWLVDALNAVGGDQSLDGVFARGQQFTGAAMLVGTIAGGLLGQLALPVPFITRAVLLVGVFALAQRTMHDIGFRTQTLRLAEIPERMAEQTRVGIAYGWRQPGLRWLMLAGGVRGAFLAWAFYASQPYFLELLDSDAVWVVGLTTAGLSVATMGGNQITATLTRRCGRRTTLLLWGTAATVAGGLVLGLAETFAVAVVGYLVIGVALGVMMPVRQTYVHQVTPSDRRATVVSFDAMIGSVGGAGGQVGLGAVSNAHGFSVGYVTGGLATLVALPLIAATRRIGGPGDEIVGEARVDGTCAGEGLPRDAVQVESHSREVVGAGSG